MRIILSLILAMTLTACKRDCAVEGHAFQTIYEFSQPLTETEVQAYNTCMKSVRGDAEFCAEQINRMRTGRYIGVFCTYCGKPDTVNASR